MAYEFKPNPFETSEADKAANLARVKAERDALDEIRGYGSDGVVVDAISEFGLKAMDASEKAAEGFTNAVSDLGALAVTAPSIAIEKVGARKHADVNYAPERRDHLANIDGFGHYEYRKECIN